MSNYNSKFRTVKQTERKELPLNTNFKTSHGHTSQRLEKKNEQKTPKQKKQLTKKTPEIPSPDVF